MYSPTSTPIMMQQPGRVRRAAGPCCPAPALRVTIYILGTLSLMFWGCCIGLTLGYCGYATYTLHGSFVSIPVNVGYVYVTCRIIFLISGSTHVTAEVLVDLQRLNARLTALLIVGFSVWATSVVWFSTYYQSSFLEDNALLTFFTTNFGFLLAVIVVGLSGGLHDEYKRQVAQPGPPSNETPTQYVPRQHETPTQYVPRQEIPLQLTVQNPPAAHHYPRQLPPPVPKPEGYYYPR